MKKLTVSGLLAATALVVLFSLAGCSNPTDPKADPVASPVLDPAVAAAKFSLAIDYAGSETEAGVMSNLTLPTTDGDVTIAWASSNESVIATNGTVTRPVIGEQYAVVNLTATLSKGDSTTTKTFPVIVRCESVALSKEQMDEAITWPNFGADEWSNAMGQITVDGNNINNGGSYIDTSSNAGYAYSFRMKFESAGNNGDFIFLMQKKANANDPADITSNYFNVANQTHGIAFTQSWEDPKAAGKGRVVGMTYGKNPLNGIWGDSATNAWTDGAFHDVTIVKSARNASNEVVFTVYLDGVQYWQQTETGVPDYSTGSYILGYNVYNATVSFE